MNLQLLADRDQALTVACPWTACAAPAGKPCTSYATGEPLQHLPAHDARLRAAGVTHPPTDPHDLARDPDRGPRP